MEDYLGEFPGGRLNRVESVHEMDPRGRLENSSFPRGRKRRDDVEEEEGGKEKACMCVYVEWERDILLVAHRDLENVFFRSSRMETYFLPRSFTSPRLSKKFDKFCPVLFRVCSKEGEEKSLERKSEKIVFATRNSRATLLFLLLFFLKRTMVRTKRLTETRRIQFARTFANPLLFQIFRVDSIPFDRSFLQEIARWKQRHDHFFDTFFFMTDNSIF